MIIWRDSGNKGRGVWNSSFLDKKGGPVPDSQVLAYEKENFYEKFGLSFLHL